MSAPLPTLQELAADALYAVSDLLDDDEYAALVARGELEQVRYRYAHADCDDFAAALVTLTGWTPVAVTGPRGPLHRLVQDEAGRLVDVHGFVSVEDLQRRYRVRRLRLVEDVALDSMLEDAEDLRRVLAAMSYLPEPPFCTAWFAGKLKAFLRDAAPPTVRPGPTP